MRQSRPQRGESFSAGKSRAPARPSLSGDPRWHHQSSLISSSSSTPHLTSATTTTATTNHHTLPSSTTNQHPSAKCDLNTPTTTTLNDTRQAIDRHQQHRNTAAHSDSYRHAEERNSTDQHGQLNTAWDRPTRDPRQVREGDRPQDKKRTPDSNCVQPHHHTRPHPMVSSKSSPNLLNKGDPAPVVVRGIAPAAAERSAFCRSVCDVPDDVRGGGGEGQRPVVDRQHGGEPGATPRLIDIAIGRIHDVGRENAASHQHHASSHQHEQFQGRTSAGMNIPKEAQCSVSQSVPLYQSSYQPAPHNQPGYKHVLSYQPDHPSVPNHQPQQNSVPTSRASFKPGCHSDSHLIQNYASESKNVPTLQTDYGSRGRDSRCVAVHSVPGSRTYENVTLLASASLKKEKGGGDGYASHVSTPSLSDQSSFQYDKVPRTQEKCPPRAQQSAVGTVRDCPVPTQTRAPPASGDSARELSSAQPGPRSLGTEHSLGMQRSSPETMKTRLEDFRPNSLPGYLPPRVDCGRDGEGGVADKGYSSSCASARDVEGVGRQLLSQRLSAGGSLSTTQSVQSTTQRRVPGSLPLPATTTSSRDTEREDKSTSPLASPRASLTSPGDNPSSASRSPSPRTPLHKDFAVASTKQPSSSAVTAGKGSGKAVLVRPTPYYNTSTQTELSAYALKTSDPRGVPQCSVQIQVDEADRQTTPRRGVEEKSIQARMSREFLPSELESSSTRLGKSPDQSTSPDPTTGARKPQQSEEKGFSPFSFRGMKSIQEKYGVEEERPGPRQESSVFPYVETGDQASIMRQLSEEFYRGSRMGDKAHLPGSHVDQAFRPIGSSSSVSSQLSSSQTSVTDHHHDLSSRRLSGQGGQTHPDYFSRSSPRPLQESKKFKSLSAISHQREISMPVMGRSLAQSHESLNPDPLSTNSRRSPSESGRDSGLFQSPSPSPRNSSAENISQRHSKVGGAFPPSSGTAGVYGTVSLAQHNRTQSVDSVLSERPAGSQRDKALTDSSTNSDGVKKSNTEMIGRKPSMKMAYGVYDDGDVLSLPKDSHTGGDPAERGKPTTADPLQLGQIKEEGNSALTPGFKPQRPGELIRHKTHGDISDTAQSLDSWRDDLDKRTGRFQNRTASEQILTPRDRSAKIHESFSSQRPPRLFNGSIDSGVGSEISCRVDGVVTPSETPRSPLLPLDNPTGAELKQIQQQAVLSFLQRKTGISFHSPESSISESTPSTPRAPQPQPKSSDPVADLISKTNATLAKRADSLRRTSSICSRSSSVEQVEVNRSRKETEWSRLRSSGSFNYGSNRSSLCSDNTYEDISVFAPSTPRGSLLETPKAGEDNQNTSTHSASQDNQRSNTDSGVMASTTAYQNIPGPRLPRRPPPPPPRSPSPEPGPPPALPPRHYGPRKEEGSSKPDPGEEEVKVDESKVDFQTVLQQCREKLSPREDAYTAQLRKLDVKFSGLRGSSPTTPPTSMSVLHSRTPTGISTSYKRQPTLAQEATPPGVSIATSSISLTPSVSSTSSLGTRASSPRHFSQDVATPMAESHISVTLSSQTKEPITSEVPVKVVVDRDTKPVSSPVGSAKPPQLPERAAPPPLREQKPAASRVDLLPPRSEGSLPKDRTVPDFQAKVSNWQFLPPPEVSRDRKLVNSHHVHPGKTDIGSASPSTDSSRSPAGKRREVPLPPPPSPGKDDQDGMGVGVGVVDPSHLPPPPPELLSDSGGHFVAGEQEKGEPFADDSYGAYRNRGSRQVGTYKRSSSAALLRPDNQHLKAATDAHAVFGDRRLGNQAWNSDTQLQNSRKVDVQQGDGTGAPQRPPDRAGISVTDGGAVRSVGRVSGVVSSAQGQAGGRGRDEGKVFAAHPFRVEQQSRAVPDKEMVNSYDSGHPSRLLKDHTEKSVTPTSSSVPPSSPLHLSSSPNSSGQRWANAIPFPTTHRVVADDVKALPVTAVPTSPHGPRVPQSRSVVLTLTDSQQQQQQQQQSRDRPSGSTSSSSATSTHSPTAPPRSRILSDRSRHGDASPTSDSRQRYAEVAPFASDPRGMPGHVRTFSQSSNISRPTSSSSIRRESAPPSHIPPEAIAMVSPRRKSEDVLSDVDKESCVAEEPVLISHGRQPSQEELECDQRAQELALEVAESDKKLSDVLNTGSSKKRMEYMNGLFSVPVEVDVKIHASVRRHQSHSAGDRPSFKPPLQNNASRAADEDPLNKRVLTPLKHSISSPGVGAEKEEGVTDSNRNALDNEAIVKHKEEVMEKLQKKQEMLKEEKKGLQEEIDGNKALGKRLCQVVDTKCSNPSERDKFHTYVSDLEKIVRLLLNLSGQLARAENAVQALGDDTDPDQKKRAVEKCEGLRTKYAEAKQLKDHIDKRSDHVTAFLRLSLSGEELKDYCQFISLTSTLTIHLQQLDDEINLGQEQIVELRKSMSEQPSLSPSSVPVSS